MANKYATRAFSGEGASQRGGRWNSKGEACVYTAGSESLAILEVLVNTEGEATESPFHLFELRLKESDVIYIEMKKLPANWRDPKPLQETKDAGNRWIESGKSLALAVPSAVVPREWIYILNPQHKGFERVVKKAKPLAFEFDMRLTG